MISSLYSNSIFQFSLLAMAFTFVASWIAILITKRLGIIDQPGRSAHKTHQFPTPLAGGIATILAFIPLVFISGLYARKEFFGLFIAILIIFIFGIWDDSRGLSAGWKLLGQSLAAIVLIIFGIKVQIFSTPLFAISGSNWFYTALNWFVTYLWIVGVTNAFNLVDSMDNLAVGISGLGFAFFALASSASDQLSLTVLSSILAGICVVLYFFNKSPAMLFLGDSGAQMMGFFLATVGILYTPLTNVQLSSWFVPIMLVAVPIFDTCLVTFSRLFHKKTIYKARLDHTYHRLTALGIHPGRAVAIMHITCLMINCLAFIAVNLPPFWANLVFICVLIVGVAIFIFFELNKKIRNTLNQQLTEQVVKS